jgi:Flp pilus assembly protein TadD
VRGTQVAPAHAMIRVRPRHWKEVMPDYRLGWAEGSREACLNNLGSLGPVARALAASGVNPVRPADIDRAAGKLYGVYSFCPDGGKYEVLPGGREVCCSLHGTAMAPRQRIAPSPGSPMDMVMKDFGGLVAELTFLEDGLHAVVTIERKSGQASSATAAHGEKQQPGHITGEGLQRQPVSAADYCMIANALARHGKADEAIKQYRKALTLKANCAEAHNGLGLVLVGKGRRDEAMAHYREALALKPDYAEVYCNVGDFYRASNEEKEKAIESYRKALAIKPHYAEAHFGLGCVLASLGRAQEAIEQYRASLKTQPNSAEAHNKLGLLLAAQGQLKEAIAEFSMATGIKWDYPEAHFNHGNALAQQGKPGEAAVRYNYALGIKPDYAEAHNGLGAALAKQGENDQAIKHFREALKINPKYTEAETNLKAAESARDGKKDKAP